MKIIAIPIFGTRVSSRLDCTENLMIFSTSGRMVEKGEKIQLNTNNSLDRINVISRVRPDVLICDGITDMYKNQLEDRNIKVIPWIRGEIDEVLKQYLNGELKCGVT